MDFEKRLTKKMSKSKKARKPRDDESDDEPEKKPFGRDRLKEIRNPDQRMAMNKALKMKANKERKERRDKRKREEKLLGDKAPPRKVAKTQDSMRVPMPDHVVPGDEEVLQDEAVDEFADYFGTANNTNDENEGGMEEEIKAPTKPHIMITTSMHRQRGGKETLPFCKDLVKVFPNSFYFDRRNSSLKRIVEVAKELEVTDLIIINEDRKQPNALMHTHLPNGPTAFYRLTNCVLMENIYNSAALLKDDYEPEVIMNNFTTRLGHTVARMLNCLIPQKPDFHGRRVMTYHNQRDFIFFRHHRYMFHTEKSASLQEIGPRFTLKLEYMKRGMPDNPMAEYEWIRQKDPEQRKNRLKFFL